MIKIMNKHCMIITKSKSKSGIIAKVKTVGGDSINERIKMCPISAYYWVIEALEICVNSSIG